MGRMRMFHQEEIFGAVDVPWASAIDCIAGGTITGGDIVVPNGQSTGRMQVVRADADAAATARGNLYIACGGALATEQLTVVPWARRIGNQVSSVNPAGAALDTSLATVGDPVYLSSVAGGITLTRPADPAEQIVIGIVTVVSATVGEIVLNPAGAASGFLAAGDIVLADNQAAAWDVREGANPYLRFRTSDLTEALYLEPNGAAGEVALTDHSGLRIGSDAVTTYVSAGDFSGHDLFVRTMQGGPSVVQANRGGRLDILVGDGGASATLAIAGGAGGRFDLRSGAGGASTNSGIAGAGGALNLFTGGGGTHSVAGAGGGGGAGGALVVETGPGGANSFAAGTAASGRGGDMGINTGVGGATSGAGATGAGGRGGNLTSVLGVGGAQSVGAGAGGAGGTYSFTAGAGGANTFAGASAAGGAGGDFTWTSGAGGATASTGAHAGGRGGDWTFTGGVGGAQSGGTGAGGRGGNYSLTLGNGGAQSFAGASAAGGAGGAYAVTTGTGGATASTGAHNAGAGGGVTTLAGNGGAHSGTGAGAKAAGAGGAIASTTGTGGAYTGGGATGTGGDAGDFTVTTGAGGATNSTGGAAQVGGTGGDYTVLLGNGGAQTGAAGNDAGRGGNYSLTAGNGGASTAANGGAGGSLALTAGDAGAGGNANGGNVTLSPGAATGTGQTGYVRIGGTAPRMLVQNLAVTNFADTSPAPITIAQLKGGVMRGLPTADRTWTLDTAANIDAGFPGIATGNSIRFEVINTAAAASGFEVIIAVAAGITSVTSAARLRVTEDTAGAFLLVKTGVATYDLYRLAGI